MASRIAVISKGILQQVDTPQHLYDSPDNLFVAGFIGSPSMNFFKGKLNKADGKLVFDGGAFHVEVPPHRTGTYMPFAGKSVILGLRPENIHDPHYEPQGIFSQKIEGKVDVTELMGNEIFLYVTAGDHTFVCRVDPRSRAIMGDKTSLTFNMNNMHLFDPETERAIR
jgi:multiple sugar transport system ATP-binding protein